MTALLRAVELRHLRYFATVGELLNFTKAAQRLRVAQPALSRQVQDLESELGVKLFERGPREVKLTTAGQAFLPEARAILNRAEEAIKIARDSANTKRGEIHVGYAPSLTVELLPCALNSFHNLAPDVQVKLHDLSSEEMVRGVADGKLNLCLAARPGAKSLRGLKFDLLQEYPICLGIPARHRLAKIKSVRVEEISGAALVAYSHADYPEYHTMLHELFSVTKTSPNIVEEHDSAPSLIAAARTGRGFIIGPACLGMLAGARLKFRPIHPAPPPVQLGALYSPAKIPSAAKTFLQAVKAASSRSKC